MHTTLTTACGISIYQQKETALQKLIDTWNSEQDKHTFLAFQIGMWTYIKEIVLDKLPLSKTIVLDNIPSLCLGHRDLKLELTATLSNLILELMSEIEDFKHVLNMKHGEEALAWFCTDHSTIYVYQTNDTHIDIFKKLIKDWTGHSINDEPTLDKVVTLLYGSICWELYGTPLIGDYTDYKKIKSCVHELSLMNPKFTFKSDNTKTSTALLPTLEI